jgi:hypothetical protein
MNMRRHLLALTAMLLAAGAVTAQVQEGEWMSYRDAYRSMVVFEKYGKPKNLIQNHLQVMARDKGVPMDGLQLALSGKGTQLTLPLDATGRTVFPLLKAAYDDNAALVLNRKGGQYAFRSRVSIVVRPDGVYDLGELRAACEQALAFQRTVDGAAKARHCVGVRFAFARRGGDVVVKLRRADGETALPVLEGAAFADDPYEGFRIVNVRFMESPDKGQVATQNAPLSIAALVE